jgi:endoglucanase
MKVLAGLAPYCLVAVAALVALASPSTAVAADEAVTITEFDRPLLFSYGTWENQVAVEDGQLTIRGVNNQGGCGTNIGTAANEPALDLSDYGDYVPVIDATVRAGTKAEALRLMLTDHQGNTAIWRIPLPDEPAGEVSRLPVADLASLAEPHEPGDGAGGPLNLKDVIQWQLIGDWVNGHALDLTVHRILILPPDAAAFDIPAEPHATAGPAPVDEAVRQTAAAKIQHTDSSPEIVHLGFVGPDMIEVHVQDGRVQMQQPEVYVAKPGDETVEEGPRILAWEGGELVQGAKQRWVVRNGERVGLLVGGRQGDPMFLPNEVRLGDPLELATVDWTGAYRVLSSEDDAYAEPIEPVTVYRKSKPNNRVMPNQGQTVRHQLFLKLAHPLKVGTTYRLAFPGLNVQQPEVEFTYAPAQTVSSAIHVSQIGYRPSDPFKRAFLSLWLGTGKHHTFEDAKHFEVVDDSGQTIYRGEVELLLAADDTEPLRNNKNFSQTAVYGLDFSPLNQAGRFHVRVPGVGISPTFEIGEEVWQQAFRQSMHGFLTQRSGIELGPPFTDYVRPRSLYPGDEGFVVFQSTTSMAEAFNEDSRHWFDALVAGKTDQTVPGAWGGYHDAGDYDRAANHLWATYLHLELLDLFPDYFGQLPLALPNDEAKDDLPDVLNEALWNVSLFKRLQRDDGAVSGGLEASEHPRMGEASWNDSLAWFAYAPDVPSTYTYATVAARTARLLEKYDSEHAREYRDSAVSAWQWAEANRADALATGYQAVALDHLRASAAVELLWLTGDDAYDAAFAESTQVPGREVMIDQQGAAFAYARLPQGLGDDGLKTKARERLIEQAELAIDYAEDNAFGLTVEIRDMPLIGPVGAFTTPGMVSQILPRVHYLTGDDRYLKGTVRAANFSAGANPDNLTMTTGVGTVAPRAPLHFDSRYSEQEVPAGITLYGAYDEDSLPHFSKANDWVHTWYLADTMTPASKTWPATEGYVDFFLWPLMNEFTIKQSLGPTSFYWGYLAARPEANQ